MIKAPDQKQNKQVHHTLSSRVNHRCFHGDGWDELDGSYLMQARSLICRNEVSNIRSVYILLMHSFIRSFIHLCFSLLACSFNLLRFEFIEEATNRKLDFPPLFRSLSVIKTSMYLSKTEHDYSKPRCCCNDVYIHSHPPYPAEGVSVKCEWNRNKQCVTERELSSWLQLTSLMTSVALCFFTRPTL